MDVRKAEVRTPVGELVLVAEEGSLAFLGFDGRSPAFRAALERRYGSWRLPRGADPGGAVSRLKAYFRGDLAALEEIAVAPHGTPFQLEVWAELRRIRAGRTIAYSELAERFGDPLAVRAVAQANARNPVAVVIPCHRVIAKDGSLHGYAGGLDRKRWLLVHEGALLA